MQQESLEEILKPKKAMIDSIKCELMRANPSTICIERASSDSNCRALCCIVAHEQAEIRNWAFSNEASDWSDVISQHRTGWTPRQAAATLAQNVNSRAFGRWSRQETDLSSGSCSSLRHFRNPSSQGK